MSALHELNAAMAEVVDLERAAGLMSWDQEVSMPPGAVEDRANQMSTLARLAHERMVSESTGALLEQAAREAPATESESFDASLVRVTRRDRDREVKVPGDLVEEMARQVAMSRPAWGEARARNDWALFEPHMQRTVELSQRLVEALGHDGDPYDALIDLDEPGFTTAEVEDLFRRLKAATLPLVKLLVEHSAAVDDAVLDRELDPERQLAFSRELVTKLGYSFQAGRLDLSAHPFTAALGAGDVRITTRVKRQTRDSCIFSSIHEAGHAMYYQGIPRALDRTRLWGASSPGVNESQSRLWENQVGRSLPFWKHFFPGLQATFPTELADQDAESYYRAINKVQPSYIRVDADEVTYNLHIMLRFELEKDLLAGRLQTREIPAAWNAKLGEYLGLEPPPAGNGCLQDIHWCYPQLGQFVGYTLGNMIAAQLMEQVRLDLPDLEGDIEAGEFAPLLHWLNERVHAHGRSLTPQELVKKVTGKSLSPDPLIAYLAEKFKSVYLLNGRPGGDS